MKKTMLFVFLLFPLFIFGNGRILYRKVYNGELKEVIFNPSRLSGKNKKNSAENVLRDFLSKNKLRIKMKDLQKKQEISNSHTKTLRYIQVHSGYPVFNSELMAVIYKGNVLKFVNNTYRNFRPPVFMPEEIAKKKLIKSNQFIQKIVRIDRGYFKTVPCYCFTVIMKNDRKLIYMDSRNGKILKEKSLIINFDAQGKVFYPNPVATSMNINLTDKDDTNYPVLNNCYKIVTLTDIDPSGILKNRFVDLTGSGLLSATQFGTYPVAEYTPGSAMETNGHYFYTRDDFAFEEVNVYYWITEARKYIESLGFNILPNPVPVNVHFMVDDNSFYSETDHGLHFGDGGVDDAEDAEIVLHEFMHAVTHYIIPGMGDSWEASSLDEGLSDYFAATFSKDENFRDYIGEWDATTYNPGNPPNLRPIKTNRHYPEDMREPYYLTGQPNIHWDGVIFSSTLWQVRKAVGREFDRDFIEFLYHLSTSTSYQSAAMSLYSADVLNGGDFKEAIGYFFYKRGILPESYLTLPSEQSGEKLYFPYSIEKEGFNSYIGLINTSNEEETITLQYIAKEGALVLKEKTITLEPYQRHYQKVNNDEIDTDFWIMAISNNHFEGFLYIISTDKSESAMVKGLHNLKDKIFVPHIAPETNYWESYSAIANCKNQQVNVTVDTHEGQILPLSSPDKPFTMNHFEWYRDFYNQNNIIPQHNWVTVNSDQSTLSAYQFFKRKDVKQFSGLTLDFEPSDTLFFPHIHVKGNYWWTGIVFVNTSDAETEATIYGYDRDGNLLDSFSINLEPYKKTVCLVQNLWEDNGRQFPNDTAWIKIKSNSPSLIGYQLFGTLPEKGARLLSGINSVTNPSNTVLFPHILSGEDFWTGIAIINASQTDGTITLAAYSDDGNPLQSVDLNINHNEKKVFLVKDVFSGDVAEHTAYIIVSSSLPICGFELTGNLKAEENGEIIQRQDYISGLTGISLDY